MDNPNAKVLGALIRKARESAGVSQSYAASAAGVSYQHWQRWEYGKAMPAADNLFKIAEILEVSVDSLNPLAAARPKSKRR